MSALARLLEQATPGPWPAADTDEDGWIVDAVSVGITVAETTRKDARLIALAPDMARLLIDWDPLIEWLAHGMCLEPDEDGRPTCEGECVTCKARESRSRFAELEQRAAP